MDAPTLKVFKVRLDGAFFEQPALVEGVLMAEEIKLMIFRMIFRCLPAQITL